MPALRADPKVHKVNVLLHCGRGGESHVTFVAGVGESMVTHVRLQNLLGEKTFTTSFTRIRPDVVVPIHVRGELTDMIERLSTLRTYFVCHFQMNFLDVLIQETGLGICGIALLTFHSFLTVH